MGLVDGNATGKGEKLQLILLVHCLAFSADIYFTIPGFFHICQLKLSKLIIINTRPYQCLITFFLRHTRWDCRFFKIRQALFFFF